MDDAISNTYPGILRAPDYAQYGRNYALDRRKHALAFPEGSLNYALQLCFGGEITF